MQMRNLIARFLAPENWTLWSERAIRVAVILLLAWWVTRLAHRLLRKLRSSGMRAMNKRGDVSSVELDRRTATVITALGTVVTVVTWVIALIMALDVMDFKIEPILAGFGVAGLAVGLGAQTLIKDWLGGVLILIEDQIRIGDAVTINSISGVVEEINLRTTIVRGDSGAVYVISNGSITTIANLTREYSYFLFEATLAHGTDIDRAIEILKEVGKEVIAEPEYEPVVLSPLEVLGVDKLADRGLVLRARIQTIPSQQWGVGRELNRRVNQRWEAEGIHFPPLT